MRRRTFLSVTALAAAACVRRRGVTPTAAPQRGIGFDGYQSIPTSDEFEAMRELGATHVALFPYARMPSHTTPEVRRFEGASVDWSLTDDGLLALGAMARHAGLRVLLLPTLADFVDGHWRGEVRMGDEAAWARWFASYRAFVLHYADLAERMGAVGFSVGTELRETVQREAQWRETIALVRERFNGWLTYAGNWDDYDQVPWWDALDLIGVQAYFELGAPDPMASPEEQRAHLLAAWEPIRARLAEVSAATNRRVAFTEIGYKSHTGATAYPWKWEIEGESDLELQRVAYEAAFETFWREPWFAGFYWWKWRPDAPSDAAYDRDFSPQGKPAESVIRRYYSAGSR
jgi:hypothetical protein